jgi:UDP-3-O-[3-hydroxymyristoyl] glucosamine N-acyltransferase
LKVLSSEIHKTFPQIFSSIDGDAECIGISSSEKPVAKTLVFANNPSEIENAIKNKASAIAATEKSFGGIQKPKDVSFLKLSVPSNMAIALVGQKYIPRDLRLGQKPGIDSRSSVDGTAKISSKSYVMPFAVIGSNSSIGENSFVGSNSFIGKNVKIGANSIIYPNVYIGDDTEIGNNVIIQANTSIGSEGFGYAQDKSFNHFSIPQNGKVVIEDNVEIGASCAIDRATFDETRIGSGSKLDNRVHIAHNVKVGKNALICAGFIVAGSTTIGDRFMCGGRVGVTDHVAICDDVQVSGQSVISKDIVKPGAYGGFPLQPIKDYFKTQATIGTIVEIRRQLSAVLKKLELK